MTGEKSAGVFAHHDLAKHHHGSSNQKDIAVITASLYPRYQPVLFRDRTRPLFGGGIDSLCHHGGSSDLANCECGRLHKALPIIDLDFTGAISCFHRITSAATGFSDTSTRENANHRTNNRRQQIDPEALQVEANNAWAERARWIHRCAADRAGKHRLQSNDGADDDSGSDSFFARAGGDGKNNKHQQCGQN